MTLSDCELAEARATISRALDEDLRYGPDVTTSATVPDGATTTASLVTREPGVIAGVDVALLVLDEVLGADGYQVLDRVEDGARLQPGAPALTVQAPMLGPVDRRADHAQPGLPPVGDRHRDRRLGRRRATAPRPRSAIPAKRCRACVRCRSTRCGSAAASTTGWGWAMRR